MRGGCGPPCSFELNQALRHARSGTAKGAAQRLAGLHATLRGGVTRGGSGPLYSFELINQARRSARSGTAKTAKGRNAAASCATNDAPRLSDARRLWADVQLRAKLEATLCK